jgi:hypothetical protein
MAPIYVRRAEKRAFLASRGERNDSGPRPGRAANVTRAERNSYRLAVILLKAGQGGYEYTQVA